MKIIEKGFYIAAIIAFSFTVGFIIGEHATNSVTIAQPNDFNADLTPVWKAWQLLEEKFVAASTTKQYTVQDHVWGLVEGLAASYNDPYTNFFPPEEAKQFEEEIEGSFGGIGIEMGMRNSLLTVIAPLKGTPADEAGLLSGDYIIEVDGTSTQNMSTDEAVTLIRGEVGTPVTLTIAREGENEFLEIEIVRGNIEIPTIEAELRSDDVYTIALYNFGATATKEMRAALRSFIESDSDKLILDLRGNPGGFLSAAVEVSSWFLPVGKTVVVEDYGKTREKVVHRSKGYDVIHEDVNIVVLIDGGSASASEIVAGALSEHERAVLIGENTFGKGSVQELVDVTEDTRLKITVARWLTPNSNSISHVGLAPDYEVELTIEDIQNEVDPQLEAAVTYLTTGTLELNKQEMVETEETIEIDTKKTTKTEIEETVEVNDEIE